MTQIFHPLEKNRRPQAPQREKSSSNWKNHPATDHPSDPNPPPTGRISTPQTTAASQILQTLEKNRRSRTPQREKSSTHWKKMDSYRLPSGKNPPDTGRISTPQTTPAAQILHPLEESVRSQDRQRGDCSSGWKNTDSHTLPSGEIIPVGGRIRTFTRSLAGRLFQWMEELRLGRC